MLNLTEDQKNTYRIIVRKIFSFYHDITQNRLELFQPKQPFLIPSEFFKTFYILNSSKEEMEDDFEIIFAGKKLNFATLVSFINQETEYEPVELENLYNLQNGTLQWDIIHNRVIGRCYDYLYREMFENEIDIERPIEQFAEELKFIFKTVPSPEEINEEYDRYEEWENQKAQKEYKNSKPSYIHDKETMDFIKEYNKNVSERLAKLEQMELTRFNRRFPGVLDGKTKEEARAIMDKQKEIDMEDSYCDETGLHVPAYDEYDRIYGEEEDDFYETSSENSKKND